MTMKRNKWFAAWLAVALVFCASAWAVETLDASRDVRLTVQFRDNGAGLPDAVFYLYRVAAIDREGDFAAVSPFDRYHVKLDQQSESAIAGVASTLEGYVRRDRLQPATSGKTGSDGRVAFPAQGKLQQGLYLVTGEPYTANGKTYSIQPALVSLPSQNQEHWVYDVTVNAKHEAVPDQDTITRKVLKVWNVPDNHTGLPEEITVHLLRDNAIFQTVKLNAANLWRHTWAELDPAHQWTVVEEELKDYSVVITREGITFRIENTYDPPQEPEPTPTPTPTPTPPPTQGDEEPKLPQTGQLWWPVAMLVCMGLLFIVLGLIRRRG